MTMAILASIGSAIASGVGAAAGAIGSVGGALSAAAGTAASTAGATSLGAALGGATAGGTAVGAGTGALAGMGLGSLGGAVAGGGSAAGSTAAGLAGAASAAPVAGTGGFIPGSMIANMGGSLAGAVPASSGTGIAGGVVSAGGTSAALPTAGSVFMGAAPSMASEAGSMLGKEALMEGFKSTLEPAPSSGPQGRVGGGGAATPRKPQMAQFQIPRTDEDFNAGFNAGFAEGGLTTLKGGGIAMRDGQYVIPADVVSAIGNGSSKAGARFLEQAFEYYMENGPPENVKPEPRAGSLAEQRMLERVQRQPA